MATKEFRVRDIVDSDPQVAVMKSKGIVKLRKIDNNGNYDPTGQYQEGTFTFEPLKGTQISDYLGFFHKPNTEAGKVLYRVRTEENGDWLYLNENTNDWEKTNSTDHWTTEFNMDKYIDDVDDGVGRFLQVKVKMIPEKDVAGYNVKSPVLSTISIFYEFIGSFMEDMKRSIKRFFDRNYRPRFNDEFRIKKESSFFSVEPAYDDVDVKMKPPAKVFNLDDDPNKTENLYDYIDDNKLYFKDPQVGDMEAYYHVKIPTYVSPADEQTNQAKMPSVFIQFPLVKEDERSLQMTEKGLVEKSKAKKVARIRKKGPLIYNITVNVNIQADRELEASPMMDEVRHLFNSANPKDIPSVQAGFDYKVIHHVDTISPDVLQDSRIVYQTEFKMLGFDYGNEALFDDVKMGDAHFDVPLIENINITTSANGNVEIKKI